MGFAFETESTSFGLQCADFGMDIATVFAATFREYDGHGLRLRRSRSSGLLNVDGSRGWSRRLLSNVDWSWRRSRWRVTNVNRLWLRWRRSG